MGFEGDTVVGNGKGKMKKLVFENKNARNRMDFCVEITNNDEEFKLRENSESDPKIFHGKRGSQVNGKEQEVEFTLVPGILEKLESLGKNSGLKKQEARSKKQEEYPHPPRLAMESVGSGRNKSHYLVGLLRQEQPQGWAKCQYSNWMDSIIQITDYSSPRKT